MDEVTNRQWFTIFALGWCARGVFEWPRILGGPIPVLDAVGDIGTLVILLALLVLLFAEPKPAPKPGDVFLRPPFEEELAEHLKRNDYSLITREQVNYLGIPVVKNPAAPPGRAVFVNPDTLTKWMDDWQETFKGTGNAHRTTAYVPPQPVDDKHLPGCRKRRDPEAKCICGERGFGGTNPMDPKFAEEFRLLNEDDS